MASQRWPLTIEPRFQSQNRPPNFRDSQVVRHDVMKTPIAKTTNQSNKHARFAAVPAETRG